MVLFVSGHHSRNAFDRTYEGLKLAQVLGLQHGPYVAAFDRTYEGLKQGKGCPRGGVNASFDRTYEGLKRQE